MKYPFVTLFFMIVMATLLLLFLAGVVWAELRLLVDNRRESRRHLKSAP